MTGHQEEPTEDDRRIREAEWVFERMDWPLKERHDELPRGTRFVRVENKNPLASFHMNWSVKDQLSIALKCLVNLKGYRTAKTKAIWTVVLHKQDGELHIAVTTREPEDGSKSKGKGKKGDEG